jgi:hypothetical protein
MLTDQQIATLVEVATSGGDGLRPERLVDLKELIAAGYAEKGKDAPAERYKLTAKGQKLLSERGVGANES